MNREPSPHASLEAALEADAEGRRRLRQSLDESLWVEAAAGTGKTTVLIERLVAVLASGRTTIDRVVAVTFTRKAAGELKLRLRQALDRQRATAEGEVRHHLSAAIGHLEEAHIGTIHSFCADLLRKRPVEAGVDPVFVEMDDEESAQIYERSFRTWIENRLEQMPPGLARALRRLALKPSFDGSSPIDRLRFAGRDLVDWRDFDCPWRRQDFNRPVAIDALIDRLIELDGLLRQGALKDPLRRDLQPVTVLAEYLQQTEEDAGQRDHDELEAQLLDLGQRLRRLKLSRVPTADFAPGVPRRQVTDAVNEFIEIGDDFERQANADLAAVLRDELREVLSGYDAAKRAGGRLDFLDLLLKSRDLLIGDAQVRRDFQATFSHIFVDEFQDTDPLQAEILLLLSADDPEQNDWRQIRPRPGSLLLVGDPKQSIYRFRRADVVLYQTMKRRLTEAGVGVVALARSFRAVKPLQQAINAAFSRSMVEDLRFGQPAYIPLAGDRPALDTQPQLVALPVPQPFGPRGWPTKAAIEQSLPTATAAFIAWILHSSGWTVDDPDQPRTRIKVEPRHVCILFRRYMSWGQDVTAPYLRALESRGVPHLLVGGRSLHQREEVETLRAALTAIEWPEDKLSMYATLRGALFGFTDEVLLRFNSKVGHFDPFRSRPELEGELFEVAEALDTLAAMHRARNEVPIAETLNRLLEHCRAHAAFALRPAGHQVLANVQRVADMARAFEVRGGLSFRGFVEQLDAAAKRPGSGGGPMVEEGAEGVRVMTVHSAKGLEFPIVVLADPACNLTAREPAMHLDAERRLCARRLLGWAPYELLDHRDVELGRDQAESVRLAYVAATRARDLLVIPGLGTRPWKGGWTSPLDSAVYPRRTHDGKPAAGCPEFGTMTTLHDPRSSDPRQGAPIRPGEHQPRNGEHRVVWWDPSRLDLRTNGNFGVRFSTLLAPDDDGEAVQEGLDRYLDWREDREVAVRQGQKKSRQVVAVTEFEQWPKETAEVSVEQVPRTAERPSGRRFGSLVHAVLSHLELADEMGCSRDEIAGYARLHGRRHLCTSEEIHAAIEAVLHSLDHPLLQRARKAEKLLHETPFLLRLEAAVDEQDLLIEGVIDLAFFQDGAWIVVDFKTDADPAARGEAYRRQVAWYVYALKQLTGEPATGVVLAV